MTIRIKYHKKTSVTAKVIRESLQEHVPSTKLLRPSGSTWSGKTTDLVVNWGSSSELGSSVNAYVLNKPSAVSLAVDKLKTFPALARAGIRTPAFVEGSADLDELEENIMSLVEDYDNDTLLFRTTSTGYGGAGIHVMRNFYDGAYEYHDMCGDDELEVEDLETYVHYLVREDSHWSPILQATAFVSAYFPGSDEYRIHVMLGKVIYVQRKALRTDELRPDEPDFTIRNHDNGFIFTTGGIQAPDRVLDASIRAVAALGLDFGAVDIKYHQRRDAYAVLEINTAPGLTGSTIEAYTNTLNSVHTVLQTPEEELLW
jgi:hypothetical protein